MSSCCLKCAVCRLVVRFRYTVEETCHLYYLETYYSLHGLYGKRWWLRASSRRFFQSGGPSADRWSCNCLRLLMVWASVREAIPFSMYTLIRLMFLSAYQVRKRETTWILQIMHFSLYHIILLGSSGQIIQYILILPNPPLKRRHVQEGFHIFHYQTAFGCFWAMVAEVLIRHRLIDLAAQL